MNLDCDISVAAHLESNAQKTRVITEGWAAKECYCLACDSNRIEATSANTQARDFLCPACSHPYELKSGRGLPGKQIRDGAYGAMMKRIRSSEAPSLLLLRYDESWRVQNLTAVHRFFLTAAVIQECKPLAATARRAGWIGCNILVGQVPPEGRVAIIESGVVTRAAMARSKFRQAETLEELTPAERGWTALTLRLLRTLGKMEFSLAEAYALEKEFAQHYPNNRHIQAKIRQQLQILRDLGFLRFEGRAHYCFPN